MDFQDCAGRHCDEAYGPTNATEMSQLLARIQVGDREAAARFVMRNERKIRHRIRWKLGPSMRRMVDSTDIVSSLARRLDSYVRDGKLRVPTEASLWRFIMDLALSTTLNKAKAAHRLRRIESRDSPWASAVLQRARQTQDDAEDPFSESVSSALGSLPDPIDKQILTLWLMDADYPAIAQDVGMTQPAVRKRWQRIKERLRRAFEEDTLC